MATPPPASGERDRVCVGCALDLPVIEGPTHPYMLSSAACWASYSRVLGREYGEFGYPETHRLTVDAYAAQHPGTDDPRALRSVAGHLVALHLTLERGMEARVVTRAIGAFLERAGGQVTRLEPPSFEGRMNIAQVERARDLAEHTRLVRAWGEDVWGAWSGHHERARAWAEMAMGGGGSGG